jgi:uncharacterized membrane protein YdbT with pleckstrin-like domain
MFRAKPVRFLALVLGLLAGLAGAVYFMAFAPTPNPAVAAVFAVVGVACLLILAVWKFTTIGEVMEISNKRTLEKTGILSKHTNEVMHRDIRNIQITQTFRERIFNVGKIVISSAAEEDSEIVAVDIPDPTKLRDVIDLYRQV